MAEPHIALRRFRKNTMWLSSLADSNKDRSLQACDQRVTASLECRLNGVDTTRHNINHIDEKHEHKKHEISQKNNKQIC